MTRILLAVAVATSAGGLLTASAAGDDPRPVQAADHAYVHSVINDPASALRVRPRTIRLRGSGGISYGRLRWSSWGARQAQAKGRQCSARTGGCQSASIRLSGLRTIQGRKLYTCLRPLRPGEARICLLVGEP